MSAMRINYRTKPPFFSTPLPFPPQTPPYSSPRPRIQDRAQRNDISPLAAACRWWWGLAAGGPARWTCADSRGWEPHCVSSDSPRWGRCFRSACSPAAGSAGGSRSSWAGRWVMSNSPRSSCPSPPRRGAPDGCRSCSTFSSCWTSSGCRMSTPPPCAGRRNWTDSIKQCPAFAYPAQHKQTIKKKRKKKKLARHASQGAVWPWVSDKGSLPESRGVKWFITVTSLPPAPSPTSWACNGAVFPLFVFVCMLNNPHVTYRQTKKNANMPKPQRQSKKKTHWCRAALPGRCSHIQSRWPALLSFLSFFLPLPGKSSRRTADSHTFSCSWWLLQTFRERFDFNRSKWATQPCFIKGSSDWERGEGRGLILHTTFAVFHKRTDAAQSQVMTTNFTRRFLYNSCFSCFFTIWITLDETIFNLESTEHMFYFSSTAHEKAKVTRATSGMSLFSSSSRVLNASVPLTPTVLCSSLKCASNSPSPLKSRWFGGSTAACLFNLSFRERIYNSSLSHTPLLTLPHLPTSPSFLAVSTLRPKPKSGRGIFSVRRTDRGRY